MKILIKRIVYVLLIVFLTTFFYVMHNNGTILFDHLKNRSIYAINLTDAPTVNIHPSYFNPFKKLEVRYSDKINGEVVYIERAKSIFSSELVPVYGSTDIYEKKPKFATHIVYAEFSGPNNLFFIIQDLIILAVLLLLLGLYGTRKN